MKMFDKSDIVKEKWYFFQLLTIFVNLLLGIGISTAVLFKIHKYEYLIKNEFCGPPNFSLVISVLMIVIVCFGFCILKNQAYGLMNAFLCILVLFSIFNIIIAVYGYFIKNGMASTLEVKLNNAIGRYIKKEEHIVESWDYLNVKFGCCGIHSYRDWFNYTDIESNLPSSCCYPNTNILEPNTCSSTSSNLKSDGCLKQLVKDIGYYLNLLIVAQFVSALFLLVVVLVAVTHYFIIKVEKYQRNSRNTNNEFQIIVNLDEALVT